jgi:predicted 3-demethylubiquinone-9 3-methyltransferase (glyoxalase superfamily)
MSKQPSTTTSEATLTPCLWFDDDAEAAVASYVATLADSRIDRVARAPGDYPWGKAGHVLTIDFILMGRPFLALNGGPYFKFNEAVSFQIPVDTQAEVDRLSDRLSADPTSEQCGWVKDRFGLSWQIVPTYLPRMLADPDSARAARVFQAMMTMKRLDIQALETAYAAD